VVGPLKNRIENLDKISLNRSEEKYKMPPKIPCKEPLEANMQHSTSKILAVYDDIFNTKSFYEIARQTGFIQRSSSKIKGNELVKALIIPSPGLSEDSLNGLCERIKNFNPDACISASALSQRINTKAAVEFMKSVYKEILKATYNRFIQKNPCFRGVFKEFNNIYIQDSTVMEINKLLARFLPGTKRGGKKHKLSCKAQLKIDLIHNIKNGSFIDAKICKGKQPDQASSDRILRILKPGDLTIRDLGYFKLNILKRIAEIGAFFLTRLPSNVKVYLQYNDKNPIDLAAYLQKNYKFHSTVDVRVYIGEERLEVRLLAYKTPKEVEVKRRRQTKKIAKEMGRITSKAKLDLLSWSIFVTNISESQVSCEVIGTIYRLRWEIELIFKTWW